MANIYLTITFIALIVFNVQNSIKKIHVQCDVQQHHIRHFHHHIQNLLQHHRLQHRHRSHSHQPGNRFGELPLTTGYGDGQREHLQTFGSQDKMHDLHNLQEELFNDRKEEEVDVEQQLDEDEFDQELDTPLKIIREAEERNSRKAATIDIEKANIRCPKCSGTTNVRVSEEELIQLRIEFVKNQILQKLRLKERPKISVSDLPRPIYEGTTIHGDVQTQSKDLDDYYARTSQKFIFLEQEHAQCDRVSQSPSICFTFKIEGDIDTIDVSTAELWIYKNSNKNDSDNKQTFVVSEFDSSASQDNVPKLKPIAIQSIGTEAGWMKIDIAWATKQWFNNRRLEHTIHILCQSCEMALNQSLLSTGKDYRPFILIDTLNRRKIRRQKRNVNCSVGVTECCREKLYISFAEIGWDDWILQPSGYDAYFCRGSCSTAASITMSNSHYSSLLRKVIYQRKTRGGKALELTPCCTAKKFSSLQLLYLDSNNTGTVKTLPNMVVESCGCM